MEPNRPTLTLRDETVAAQVTPDVERRLLVSLTLAFGSKPAADKPACKRAQSPRLAPSGAGNRAIRTGAETLSSARISPSGGSRQRQEARLCTCHSPEIRQLWLTIPISTAKPAVKSNEVYPPR